MPRKKRSEIVAGAAVVVGLALALGVILWLGVVKPFHKPGPKAYFFLPQEAGTAGLNVGNAVHYAGLEVGRVVELQLQTEQKRTLYVTELHRGDLPLYADGTAMVVIGLVGESILAITDPGDVSAGPTSTKRPIEITGGWGRLMQSIDHISEELDPTRPGSLLANIKVSAQHIEHLTESMRGQMDPDNPLSLMARAQESMDAFAETASAMRQELDPDEPMSAISQISDVMLGIDSLLADASPKISDTLQSLSVLLERLDDYARVDLAEILWQLRQSNENLGRTTDNFAQLSERARDIVDRTSVSMNQTMDNVALTSSNLRGASAEIRRNPWRLLYRPDDRELRSANILAAAREFANGAAQLEMAVTRLRTVDTEVIGEEELNRLRQELHESVENFTRLQRELFRELAAERG